MQTATEALTRVEREATQKHVTETRIVKTIEGGRVARQGDIYLHRVADDHPRGRQLAERQLARGVTTGSRHVAERPARIFEGTTLPAWVVEECRLKGWPLPPLGPCIEAKRAFTVSHPEHAHMRLPAGVYQVTYQRDERTGVAVTD